MAFTLASAMRGGARAGAAAAIGIGAGSLVWAGLTAAGLAALIASSQQALTLIRIAGGAYLIFLAVQTYRHRHEAFESAATAGAASAFRTGLITNLLNPKVGVFFLAFVPIFLDPAAGPVWVQALLLGAVFSASGAAVLVGVALAAGGLRARLGASPAWIKRLRMASAAMFGGLGLGLLLSRSH